LRRCENKHHAARRDAAGAGRKDKSHRNAAPITFLVALSGVVIAGVGSAFWVVVAGGAALFVQQYGQPRRARLPAPAQTTTTSSALKNP